MVYDDDVTDTTLDKLRKKKMIEHRERELERIEMEKLSLKDQGSNFDIKN